MSTESRRSRRAARARGRFALSFAAVLGALAVVGGAAAGVSVAQGPRATEIQVDPAAATEESGSRVIFTANQSLSEIDPERVSVEPAVDFSVDAAGRMVGVRFPTALDAGTTYTVRVEGVTGAGGGPASDLETTFTTPAASFDALVRDDEGADRIVRHTVGSDEPETVFEAEQIDDFRATSAFLVATVADGDEMRVVAIDRATGDQAEIPLPDHGTVNGLQVSERGQLFGFTFTDRELSETSGRVNVLFTGSLRDAFTDEGAALQSVEIGGEEPSVDRWRFVPETSSLLLNDFDGDLTLVDRESADGEVSSFGTALGIHGVARSTYTALIERAEEGFVELDLASGEQRVIDDVDLGVETLLGQMIPLADGGTLRAYAEMVDGLPADTRIVAVGADGSVREVATVPSGDGLMQVCASPSAQYAAVAVASDLVGNTYDRSTQPMPSDMETRVYEIDSGEEVLVAEGFDASWCEVGPW
ncbi:MAG TPA: Ig-like domain-containing protein [Microbacterium sp.]|nr:Ig-like domain-containing protein [Microbacterium sp.]